MKIRKPRASAYIRGPKIGPVHTVVHLGSVGVGSRTSPARTTKLSAAKIASLQPACAEVARKIAACDTISQRVAFRAAFEKTADPVPGLPITEALRLCGWNWDDESFLRQESS